MLFLLIATGRNGVAAGEPDPLIAEYQLCDVLYIRRRRTASNSTNKLANGRQNSTYRARRISAQKRERMSNFLGFNFFHHQK